MTKLGQLFAGIAIISAGIGITILSKKRKEILVLEEELENVDA